MATNGNGSALAHVSAARRELALAVKAKDLNGVKRVKDIAARIKDLAKTQRMGLEAQNEAAEVKLRAERAMGRLLKESEQSKVAGRPKKIGDTKSPIPRPPALADLGIARHESSRCQRIASLPDADFEEYVESATGEGRELTSAGALRLAKSGARAVKIADIERGNRDLATTQRYSVLLADPPWRYEFAETDSRKVENQYPTMTVAELCALPVDGVAGRDAVLFLWATSPKLLEALAVMDAWGFGYRTCMVWVKDRIGMGYYARQRHELLLIGKRGGYPAPEPSSRPDSVIDAARAAHSAKPDEAYAVIEAMYPEASRLELFSRRPRDGWAAWGNQA